MNRRVEKKFAKIERLKQDLITLAEANRKKFNQRQTNSWSIEQILAHLITAEKLSVRYLEKKIQGIEQADATGIWEDVKMFLLTISQRLPLKFKAPKTVVDSTPTYDDLESLVSDWATTREQLRVQLLKIKDEQVKAKIFKHIIAGKLNILHALDFLGEHIKHHMPQIRRALK